MDIRILIMSHSYHNLLPQQNNKVNYHLQCHFLPLHLEHQLHVPPTMNGVALEEPLPRIAPVIRVHNIRLLLPTMTNVLAGLTNVRFFLILLSQTTHIAKSMHVSAVV